MHVCMCVRERERDREREIQREIQRETETERHIETDRDRDRELVSAWLKRSCGKLNDGRVRVAKSQSRYFFVVQV